METCEKTMVTELTQGQELAKLIQCQLSSAASVERCSSLVEELLLSLERALAMAKGSVSSGSSRHVICPDDSPGSDQFTDSPRSNVSDQVFQSQDRKIGAKKRKSQLKCTAQIRLGSGPGADGPLDDGYSWRKYGQKQILGAKHPRGYYRCTYRSSQGCLAMRQVQRTDDNYALFKVTYRGSHTCRQKSTSPTNSLPPFPTLLENYTSHSISHQHPFLSFQRSSLKVETDDLAVQEPEPTPSFPFSSTPTDSCLKSNFAYNNTPALASPTASESNYFAPSPCGFTSADDPTMLLDMLEVDPDFTCPDFTFENSSYFELGG